MPHASIDNVVTERAPCGLICTVCESYIAKKCLGCYPQNSKSERKCIVLDGNPCDISQELIKCMKEKKVVKCTDCKLFESCETYEALLIMCPFKRPIHDLKPGFGYLVKEKKPELGFKIFADLVRHEIEGLSISRTHPKYLKEKLGKRKVKIFWLTTVEGRSNIDPTKIGILSDLMINFIQKHEDTVILLDGLELLITHNDFPNALRMVNHITEQVMQHNARFVITIDEMTLDQKELALLERSMEVVET
jgi:hypothetical protein